MTPHWTDSIPSGPHMVSRFGLICPTASLPAVHPPTACRQAMRIHTMPMSMMIACTKSV